MSSVTSKTVADPLDTDIQYVRGVGPKLALMFQKAGLKTVRDLLWHLPRRYEDRTNLPKIRELRDGMHVTVRGKIIAFEGRPTKGGKVLLKAALNDGTGTISLVWFNQPWVKTRLQNCESDVIAYGTVKQSGFQWEMSSPEFEILGEDEEGDEFAKIVPVYPLVEGLRQFMVRRAAANAVEKFSGEAVELLPLWLLKKYRLKSIGWCLRQIHRPDSEEQRLEARRRLVFEEFLALQLALENKRRQNKAEKGISFPISSLGGSNRAELGLSAQHLFVRESAGVGYGESLWDEVGRMLPFELTNAQRRVIQEIWADMESNSPMQRLVQGDVGSGKTAVAACAMLAAVRCGYQAALMAPTEILAEQHAANLKRIFEPIGIEVSLLVGKQSKTQKKTVVAKAQALQNHILVGTHALIEDAVQFGRLGLVVIDEQHRFGVNQRAALVQKGHTMPDVLVMTATPIPRTLTLTLHGDLDVSKIDELPPGRKPISTHWKVLAERNAVYETARNLIEDGAQVFVVCPMVAESEKVQAQAAEELFQRLSTQVYPDLRVGLLHGQMKPAQKEDIMEQFRRHDLDVLVSTTVIEVGVDVPNASVMIIEDANRFGLAQLHQLRGRVGRGERKSFCLLLADAKSEDARVRMETMVETTDGFRISEVDLDLRGPGDMLGKSQSGFLDFIVADLVKDAQQLDTARQAAIEIFDRDPDLSKSEHDGLRQLMVRFGQNRLAAITS